MTDRLYYQDCYLREFRAHLVDSQENAGRIYLDRTAFYPTSGGQPHDLGTVNGLQVADVIDEGENIVHILAPGEASTLSGAVECRIDWLRRYDHMQQHTGQHLISAVLMELFGFSTLSFHMGAETSAIELSTPDLTNDQIEVAEGRVQELIAMSLPVSIGFDTAEAVGSILRKPSERTGTLRIIQIAGIDRSACGGTHVRSTSELGPIQLRKTEKVRGNVRIEFVCGQRAQRRIRQDFRLLSDLSRLTSVAIDDLPAQALALRDRLALAEKERERLALDLAARAGEAEYDASTAGPDGLRRASWRVPSLRSEERARASAFIKRGKAVAVVVGVNPSAVLVAASADTGLDAGSILKKALGSIGGRGGGSSTVAQGNVPVGASLDALFTALGMKIS